MSKPLIFKNFFTSQWNKQHPHTPECVARHQSLDEDTDTDECLICLVNSYDLDDEFNPQELNTDYNTCICPNEVRPYKAKGAIWSLQKAVQYTFDQALDKSVTLNFWSCELDLSLNTWNTGQDKITRQVLIDYAMNDVFTATNLFFHLYNTPNYKPISIQASHLNSIMHFPALKQESLVVLADSHGKNLNPIIITPNCHIITYSIRGLQWINTHDQELCTRSIILKDPLSSLLTSCSHVSFLMGINSVRNLPATHVINQVQEVLNLLCSEYLHLTQKHSISIFAIIPCQKTSTYFPSTFSLTHNIDSYNQLLQSLSSNMKFSCIDLNITTEYLSSDQLHINHQYKKLFSDTILTHLDFIINQKPNPSHTKRRSREAIAHKNKKRHTQLKNKQQQHTLVRSIHSVWSLKYLKQFLKHHQIKYSRLSEVYHHKIRINFNNSYSHDRAERALSFDAFNELNFRQWIQEHN